MLLVYGAAYSIPLTHTNTNMHSCSPQAAPESQPHNRLCSSSRSVMLYICYGLSSAFVCRASVARAREPMFSSCSLTDSERQRWRCDVDCAAFLLVRRFCVKHLCVCVCVCLLCGKLNKTHAVSLRCQLSWIRGKTVSHAFMYIYIYMLYINTCSRRLLNIFLHTTPNTHNRKGENIYRTCDGFSIKQ